MMEVWRKIRLGDVCVTNASSYSPKEGWNFVNYLDTGNITNNEIDSIQYLDIGSDKLPSRARRKVKNDSIIYSSVRPNQRHFGIIKSQPENFLVSTGFIVIDVNAEVLNADFIYYLLSQSVIVESLHAIAEQSTSAYPSIKSSDIEDLEIEIPELNTQKKIAEILSSLDKKIALNIKVNENLLQQAQALYNHSFPYTVSDILPEGWRLGTVSEIIEIHDSKRIPLSGAQRDKMKKKIYPYYGAASLMDYVDEYIFDGKYLLLGEDGTVVDDAGFPILQYVWGQFWVNNHAHILTGKLGYNVESLYMLFKQTPVKSIVTGAVQPKISQANLKSIPVVIPPANLIRAFNNQVNEMFALIRNIEEENKSLATLRDSLLPKLMSGEIDLSALDI